MKETGLWSILNIDCLKLARVLPRKFGLVFTSPPYNVGILYDQYNDSRKHDDYMDWLVDTFWAISEVVVEGGHMCWNIPISTHRVVDKKESYPLGAIFMHRIFEDMTERDTGWKWIGQKTWDKGGRNKHRPTMGSMYNKPAILNSEELIHIFRNGDEDRYERKGGIPTSKFVEFISHPLRINPGKSPRGHPATFPRELVRPFVEFLTWEDEWVFDPFAGLGTAMVETISQGRNAVGCDISKFYCGMARTKLMEQTIFNGEQMIANRRAIALAPKGEAAQYVSQRARV